MIDEIREICSKCGAYEHGECTLCTCAEPDNDYDGINHPWCRQCGGKVTVKYRAKQYPLTSRKTK